MSSAVRDDPQTPAGGSSLKDELASLKIERHRSRAAKSDVMAPQQAVRRRDGGSAVLRLLSWVLWLIPIGLISGVSYFAYQQYLSAQPKILVKTLSVRAMTPGEANTVLEAKGYLKSRYQAQIGAKVPGRVREVKVEEGTRVQKGEILAVLEHEDLRAQLESRKAMLARSTFDLEEARSDLVTKRDRAVRYQRLSSLGQSSDEEADQAISAWRMAESKTRSLEASIKLQESMIKETEVSIEDMLIRAPFDGTVVAKGAEVGETIMLGGMGAASGRGSVATVANLDLMEVEADITESQLARIAVGQPAEVGVSAVPRQRFKGRVRRIVPLGDRARGTVKVYVEILEPDNRLFPELVATVNFLPGSSEGAAIVDRAGQRTLYVPRSAVVERDGQAFVWTVDRDNVLAQRAIKAESEGERARIIEGLSEGDTIVENPPAGLVEGQAVELDD
jgi:RND family efflux transporter MFP subunit